jgi:hypothetical protein
MLSQRILIAIDPKTNMIEREQPLREIKPRLQAASEDMNAAAGIAAAARILEAIRNQNSDLFSDPDHLLPKD